MNIEEIKRIAESVETDKKVEVITQDNGEQAVFLVDELGSTRYDPEQTDSQCFKVLEALVKKNPKKIFLLDFASRGGSFVLGSCESGFKNIQGCGDGKTLQESICRAYLNTVGEEG